MEKLTTIKNSITSKINNNIRTKFNDIVANPSTLIFIIFIIIIFIVVGFILFNKNIDKITNKNFVLNKEFINKDINNTGDLTVIYFYTNWCPYCKKSRPEWESFKELVKTQAFADKVVFKDVDCDADPETANNFNVEGYPTIKIIYKNEVYDYDAKPEASLLLQFVESIITDTN